MTLPFTTLSLTLPDWLPWWAALVLIVPGLLYGLALLVMPFAVLGVKARLDAIDLRLDEIQGEIRSLSLRLREPSAGSRDGGAFASVDPAARTPIPPAHRPSHADPRAEAPAGGRAEPRLNWPRSSTTGG